MEKIIIGIGILWLFLSRSVGKWAALDNSKYSALSKYWKAVSTMETANYTSPLFLQANNMFGMKQPAVRTTVSHGPVLMYGTQWASYSSPSNSVEDIVLYMNAFNYPTSFVSLQAMIEFMGAKGYYGSESPASYYAKCVGWANSLGLDISNEPQKA